MDDIESTVPALLRLMRGPSRVRAFAVLLGLWAVLLQTAVAGFHHHTYIDADDPFIDALRAARIGTFASSEPGVGTPASTDRQTGAPAGDHDDGHDCAVCQMLHFLQGCALPGLGHGLAVPAILVFCWRHRPTGRPPLRRKSRRHHPRAPPLFP